MTFWTGCWATICSSFHVQDHCNNFLETVDRSTESRVDMEQFSVTRNGKTTLVQPHPISIDPDVCGRLAAGESGRRGAAAAEAAPPGR